MKPFARPSHLAAAAALLMLIVPGSVMAHDTLTGGMGFVGGFLHPLSGIDHCLAAFGAGALAQRLGGKARVAVPLAYLTGLVVAMLATTIAIQGTALEVLLAMTVGAIGLLMLASTSLRARLMCVAGVFVFATLHGHAHRIEHLADGAAPGLVMGFAAGTTLLLCAGSVFANLSFSRRLFPRPMALGLGSASVMLLVALIGGGA